MYPSPTPANSMLYAAEPTIKKDQGHLGLSALLGRQSTTYDLTQTFRQRKPVATRSPSNPGSVNTHYQKDTNPPDRGQGEISPPDRASSENKPSGPGYEDYSPPASPAESLTTAETGRNPTSTGTGGNKPTGTGVGIKTTSWKSNTSGGTSSKKWTGTGTGIARPPSGTGTNKLASPTNKMSSYSDDAKVTMSFTSTVDMRDHIHVTVDTTLNPTGGTMSMTFTSTSRPTSFDPQSRNSTVLDSKPLSSGGVAGIATGVTFLVLFAAVGIWLGIRMRKKLKKVKRENEEMARTMSTNSRQQGPLSIEGIGRPDGFYSPINPGPYLNHPGPRHSYSNSDRSGYPLNAPPPHEHPHSRSSSSQGYRQYNNNSRGLDLLAKDDHSSSITRPMSPDAYSFQAPPASSISSPPPTFTDPDPAHLIKPRTFVGGFRDYRAPASASDSQMDFRREVHEGSVVDPYAPSMRSAPGTALRRGPVEPKYTDVTLEEYRCVNGMPGFVAEEDGTMAGAGDEDLYEMGEMGRPVRESDELVEGTGDPNDRWRKALDLLGGREV